MSMKRGFVPLASQEEANLTPRSARSTISRPAEYRWEARDRADLLAGLTERSRCPINSPGQLPTPVEDTVLALRYANPAWGGRKLRARPLALGAGTGQRRSPPKAS